MPAHAAHPGGGPWPLTRIEPWLDEPPVRAAVPAGGFTDLPGRLTAAPAPPPGTVPAPTPEERTMSESIQIRDEQAATAGHACGCHEHEDETPVLDVRAIPHAVRHAAIFGAFEAIAPGRSIVLVAPHAPVPMLTQLARRAPIDVEYLVEGPTEWHVKVTRTA